MARVVSRFEPERVPLDRLLAPREYPVLERSVGEGEFEAAEGPVRTYRRTVAVDERGRAVETAEFRLAVPYFAWIFVPFFRAALRTPDGDRRHWWFPPDRFDARASSVLGTLCAVAVVFGYLNTLFSQTIAFAGDEFGASNGAQGVAGGVVRTGGLLALVLVAMADRRGRRSVVLATAVGGCLLAATGALAPSP